MKNSNAGELLFSNSSLGQKCSYNFAVISYVCLLASRSIYADEMVQKEQLKYLIVKVFIICVQNSHLICLSLFF